MMVHGRAGTCGMPSRSPQAFRAPPELRSRSTSSRVRAVAVCAANRLHRHAPSRQPNCTTGSDGRSAPPSAEQTAIRVEIEALNGPTNAPGCVSGVRSLNAIGNLRTDSPLLQAVGSPAGGAGVPYHTIAFQFAGHAPNDLVVPRCSSRLDGAASEAIFPGTHASEQGPAALGRAPPHPAGAPGRALNIDRYGDHGGCASGPDRPLGGGLPSVRAGLDLGDGLLFVRPGLHPLSYFFGLLPIFWST